MVVVGCGKATGHWVAAISAAVDRKLRRAVVSGLRQGDSALGRGHQRGGGVRTRPRRRGGRAESARFGSA